MSKEAMKLALEALKQIDEAMPFPVAKLAQAALRKALAEQPAQQEPVAWMDGYRNIYSLEEKAMGCEDAVIPLIPATLHHWSDCAVHNEPAYPKGKCDCGGYTSPPAQRQWVGLSDEQINAFFEGMEPNNGFWLSFARAIEAKLKEKNT